MKKSKLLATGLALTLALAACSSGGGSTSELRNSDKPYMSINGQEISKKDFYKQYDLYAQVTALNNQLSGQVMNIYQRDFIIKRDIKDNKIEVKEEDYKKAMDEAIKGIGGEEAFKDYLNYMNTTREVFETNIKANVDSDAHTKWYNENHPASEEKLLAAYETSKSNVDWIDTKHILVKTEEEAKKAYKELKDGADFKAVSDKYSIDEGAKANGGSIGKYVVGQLDQGYVEGAKKLEKGEISEPVKSSFGYHIIELVDKGIGVEANKEQLTKMVNGQEIEKYISEEIQKLEIKLYDNEGKEIKQEATDQPAEENKEE